MLDERLMPDQIRVVHPAFPYDHVRLEDGTKVPTPEGWALLPPGDAMMTRRVKSAGPHWLVQEKVGKRMMSRGIWAPAAIIEAVKADVEAEKNSPEYARKQAAAAERRDKAHRQYVEDFAASVREFLGFHPRYEKEAQRLAQAVADHATPVGSGTVARTQRISIEERAAAAVIAWMRHQTTAYDNMRIQRVKGKRREVRRELAQRSKEILQRYRRGKAHAEHCPLAAALKKLEAEGV